MSELDKVEMSGIHVKYSCQARDKPRMAEVSSEVCIPEPVHLMYLAPKEDYLLRVINPHFDSST